MTHFPRASFGTPSLPKCNNHTSPMSGKTTSSTTATTATPNHHKNVQPQQIHTPEMHSQHSIQDYRVLKLLGEGTFGKVSLVEHVVTKEQFVWKELFYGNMSDQEKAQLVNEVNLLRELRHPNIVRYDDRLIDRRNKIIYIIMEHCPLGDLQQLMKRTNRQRQMVAQEIIWQILFQLSNAILFCHQHSCIHRDIKASNVLLDKNGTVKLCDFGLARVLSSSTKNAHTNVGTPFYQAPEQITSNLTSSKSDSWQLGCLLYELCTFQPPFVANNQLALARLIEKGSFDEHAIVRAGYSMELLQVIKGLLQVDTVRRWTVDMANTHAQSALSRFAETTTLLALGRLSVSGSRFNHQTSPITTSSTGNSARSTKYFNCDGNESSPHSSSLEAREKLLQARERACTAREHELDQKEAQLRMKECALNFNYGSDVVSQQRCGNLITNKGHFDSFDKNSENRHSNHHGLHRGKR